MEIKRIFIEVLVEEKQSIRRTIEVLEGEREDMEQIEQILEEKSNEEMNTLIKQVLKQEMRGKSGLMLDWLKGKNNAR